MVVDGDDDGIMVMVLVVVSSFYVLRDICNIICYILLNRRMLGLL